MVVVVHAWPEKGRWRTKLHPPHAHQAARPLKSKSLGACAGGRVLLPLHYLSWHPLLPPSLPYRNGHSPWDPPQPPHLNWVVPRQDARAPRVTIACRRGRRAKGWPCRGWQASSAARTDGPDCQQSIGLQMNAPARRKMQQHCSEAAQQAQQAHLGRCGWARAYRHRTLRPLTSHHSLLGTCTCTQQSNVLGEAKSKPPPF